MSTILTNKGVYFDFGNPEAHPYDIEEIAHALSHICRFTGHVREFYSVAEHSVYVSMLVPRRYQLAALLHDASEAYLGDMASPLKAIMHEYKALEKVVEQAIARSFKFPDGLYPMHPSIKHADTAMLMAEKGDLMPVIPDDMTIWPSEHRAYIEVDRPMNPVQARTCFLARFKHLGGDL